MSRAIVQQSLPHGFLENEAYVSADPRDPARPLASRELSRVVMNRAQALIGFFCSGALEPLALLERLGSEACARELGAQGLVLPRPAVVAAYLVRHPEVTPVVRAISRRAGEMFDAKGEIVLDVYQDPEIEDEYLAMYVRRQEYGEDTLGKIEALGGEAARMLGTGDGWLLVTTDFRPPGRG